MAVLSWKPEFATNIRQVDADHQKLVDLINSLHDAMAAGKANDVLGKTLGELIAYTRKHFAAEESLMKLHGYPDYAAHKKEHEDLTKTVVELQQRFNEGKGGLTISTFTFLKDWLTKHIKGTDMKYAPYLRAKGVM